MITSGVLWQTKENPRIIYQIIYIESSIESFFESYPIISHASLSTSFHLQAYLTAFSIRTLVPRRFCKASAALLAQQLARGQLQGPVAVVHFVSAGTSVQLARRAAGSCLRQVLQAGGRGRYFATTIVGDGDVETW